MTHKNIPIEQQIVNKINAKQEFTYPNETKRYIVGIKELHKSLNPSYHWKDETVKVYYAVQAINEGLNLTIGQWFDKETKEYCIDLGTSLDSLPQALKLAKNNNQKAIYDSLKKEVIFLK